MIYIIIAILFLSSCAAVHEPLPGLCYTDTEGTYLCVPEIEEIDPIYIDPIPNDELLPWDIKTEEEVA